MPLKVRAVVLQSLLELRVHMEGLDAGINLALELAEADLGFKGIILCAFSLRLIVSPLLRLRMTSMQCKPSFSHTY